MQICDKRTSDILTTYDFYKNNPHEAFNPIPQIWFEAYNILSKTVRADEIFTEGNSIHEWGYDPKAVEAPKAPEVPKVPEKPLQEKALENYLS